METLSALCLRALECDRGVSDARNSSWEMERQCRDTFFCGEMIPPYEPQDDAEHSEILCAVRGGSGLTIPLRRLICSRLDVAAIARKIWDERHDSPGRDSLSQCAVGLGR